jgi:hypothetical protein
MMRIEKRPDSPKRPASTRFRLRLLSGIVFSLVAVIGFSTTAIAQQKDPIENLPHALICAKGEVTVIGYLTRIDADGSAVYMTLNSVFVTVSPDGTVGDRSAGTCSGKTLAELRAAGQTREFAQ